jgi:type II secretory pathway pseudopilin PulG
MQSPYATLKHISAQGLIMKPFSRLQREGGFTIVEALVALLIMTFGMLAISGMQMSLSQNSDISKQRTEATRLANEKMEELRSFTAISTGTITWNGLADGSDTISTNTTYTRSWSLSGTITDAYRPVTVAVSWLDRVGTAQGITLNSVISATDPKNVGFLGFPLPENEPLKRVKNRSLDIPIPAISLTGYQGLSGYNLSGTGLSIVFDDYNGAVVKSCPTTLTAGSSLTGCATITATIVAGYIHDARAGNGYNYRSTVTYVPGDLIQTTGYSYSDMYYTCVKSGVTYYAVGIDGCHGGASTSSTALPLVLTKRLLYCKKNGGSSSLSNAYFPLDGSSCDGGYSPNGYYSNYTSTLTTITVTSTQTSVTTGAKTYLGINTGTNVIDYSNLTWWDATNLSSPTTTTTRTVTCVVDQAVDQNTLSTLSTYTVTSSGLTYAYNFKYYLCIVYTGSNVRWSGTMRVKGIPKTSTDSNKQFLGCRYQYKTQLMGNNARNVQPYSLVADSLDNQNYLVEFSTVATEGSTAVCPTTTLDASQLLYASGSGSIPVNLQAELVVHQDCRNLASNTSVSTNCPQ